MRRHEFITAGATSLLLAAKASPARAAATVTTQIQWVKDVQNAGWWVADANGYFRDAGITSNVLAGGPSLASVEAVVAAGRADVGMDNFERVLDANAAGSDFVVFAALYQQNPAGLLSLPAKPVRTARDIIGKRIGLQQGGNVYLDAILAVNHLPKTYTEVVVGSDPAPLVEGACDAFLSFVTNEPLTLAARGIPTVTVTFDQLGYVSYADCLFCTRDYLKANRATLVAYLHALQRGWVENAAHAALAPKLVVTNYGSGLGLDEKQQLAVNHAQIPLMQSAQTRAHGAMWIDRSRIAGPVYATMRATGRTKLPAIDRIVDFTILRDAARA